MHWFVPVPYLMALEVHIAASMVSHVIQGKPNLCSQSTATHLAQNTLSFILFGARLVFCIGRAHSSDLQPHFWGHESGEPCVCLHSLLSRLPHWPHIH